MRSRPGRAVSAVIALVLGAGLATAGPVGQASAAPSRGDADPAVVMRWNAATVTTLVEAGRANPQAFYWYALTHLAVHNAVNGITRAYRLYEWHQLGPVAASPEAAAAVAAHHVLATSFPAASARLDATLADSLAQVADGPAKEQGMRYGARAAAHLLELRQGDGRDATVTFDQAPAAGVWRPTPPGFAPMLVPWVGFLRPFAIESAAQFRPPPPPALTSATYTRDFDEVARMGRATGSERTAAQTQTALFFSDVPAVAMQVSLRDLATRHALDISDAARLFAGADMSVADAIITVWNSKHRYGFWRPVTAIALADQDQNPDTAVVSDWLPLITTPPYPEYAAGTPAVLASFSTSVPRLMGTTGLDLNITSVAAGAPGAPLTRHYDDPAALRRDVIDARVWAGVHFRFTDEISVDLGRQVTSWVLDHTLAPR